MLVPAPALRREVSGAGDAGRWRARHTKTEGNAGSLLDRARAVGPLIDDCADEIEERRELPPRLVTAC